MRGEGKLSVRAIAAAAAALGLIGMVLLFGGGPDDPVATTDPTPTGTPGGAPSGDGADPHDHEHESEPTATPTGGPVPTAFPTVFPTAGVTPEAPGWRPPPTTYPTSATGAPTEPPDDPHAHETPSPDDVENAPPPEFNHEFRVEVDQALAEQLQAIAWAWLEPNLIEESWSYLKLLEFSVLETSEQDGETLSVAVELGFSGVNGLGHIGVGVINTVFLQQDGQGGWMLTGYRDGRLPQED